MVHTCVERLKTDREVLNRTGYAFGLGNVIKVLGSLDVRKYLRGTVGVLQALAGDTTLLVQAWSLHALALTAQAAGSDFMPFFPATLKLVQQLVLNSSSGSIVHCAGRLLGALVEVLGPELAADTASRDTIFSLCRELDKYDDGFVLLTALQCFQQLIMFIPNYIDIPVFVPRLQTVLESPHIQVRTAAAACLRQLAQRQPDLVSKYGVGLEDLLFKLLDTGTADMYTPVGLQADLQHATHSLLQARASLEPSKWLLLCNTVLSGPVDTGGSSVVGAEESALKGGGARKGNRGEDEDEEGGGEESEEKEGAANRSFVMGVSERKVVSTRWQTKVFAVECVRKIMVVCAAAGTTGPNGHFHVLSKNEKNADEDGSRDWLITKLGELIRTSFICATSTIDQLRGVGLDALHDVIARFSSSMDTEMGGSHRILEQYQAQVTAALRPAFSADSPPDVTATACRVCAAWITSGVNREAADLRRVQGLLVTRLAGVVGPPDAAYNERATTNLHLALLNSWANIFIMSRDGGPDFQYLEQVIAPHIEVVTRHLFSALNDFALISLSSEYRNQIPEVGSFYYRGTRSAVLPYYERSFPSLIHAAGLTLAGRGSKAVSEPHFYLLLGLCTRALCGRLVTS